MKMLNTYVFFDGTCADAMRFYQRTLGGKLDMITNAESPAGEHSPKGSEDRIMHARLELQGGVLMASDRMAGHLYAGMHGFSLSLVYPTAAEARPIFDALADGGKITMPFDKTFWADGFGMLVDRFGAPWMVNGGMASH